MTERDAKPGKTSDAAEDEADGLRMENEALRQELAAVRAEMQALRGAHREQKELLDGLIDLNPYAIGIADAAGHPTRLNQAMIDLMESQPPPGYSFLEDEAVMAQLTPEQRERLLAGTGPIDWEVYYNPRERNPEAPDKPLWLQSVLFPLHDDRGAVSAYVILHRDITERKRIEAALREAHERLEQRYRHQSERFEKQQQILREIMHATRDIFFKHDFTTRAIEYLSPSFEEAAGYRIAEAMTEGLGFIQRHIHPEDRPQLLPPPLSEVERAAGTRERDDRVDFRWRHRDGSWRWMRGWRSTRFADDGTVLTTVGVLRDVTEERRASEALAASEKRFRLLAQNATDVIWMTDANLRPTYASPSIRDMLGYPPEAFYQEDPSFFVDTEDLNAIRQAVLVDPEAETLALRCEPSRVRVRLRPKAGAPIWADVVMAPVLDDTGAATGLMGITRDITAQLRAEEALQETLATLEQRVEERTAELKAERAHFRSLMETASNYALYRLRRDLSAPHLGVPVLASPTLSTILGPVDLEDLGTWFRWVMPEDQERLAAASDRAARSGHPLDIVFRVDFGEGVRWLRAVSTPAPSDSQGVLYYNGICVDITERKQAEEGLIRAERLAAVGTLASGVAHEFNNLNHVIHGWAVLLLESDLAPKVRQGVERILRASQRAASITENLLVFARARTGLDGVASLNDVVRDTLALVETEYRSEGIEIRLDLGEVPPIVMDASAMGQVVMNLLINARHAMLDREERSLTVQTRRKAKHGVLRVSDTGIGIPTEDLPRIFSPFYSTKGEHAAPNSPQSAIRGSGLGLSVCQTVVQNHGGDLSATSEIGQGSTFELRLPLRTLSPDGADAGRSPTEGDGEGLEPTTSTEAEATLYRGAFAGQRILLVDDEEEIRRVIAETLRKTGATLATAADGRAALDHLAATTFDLLALDLQMPVLGGLQLLEQLRGEDDPARAVMAKASAPRAVLIMTGQRIADDLAPFRDLYGASFAIDILKKPFLPNDFLAACARLLGHTRQS